MEAKNVINAIGLGVLLCIFAQTCFGSDSPPQAQNRVVVIIDGSGSYRSRQEEAVQKAISLLDSIAETKLHRWEPARDSITLISLDAIPEVLWEGTSRDLKGVDRGAWKNRFLARTDYQDSSDVVSAFQLAARKLEGGSPSTGKYVIAFTDLIHQPPMDSLRRARPAMNHPPEDFPWQSFKDVSVSVFWVPPDQKFIWSRAANTQGLGSNFSLYTTSESSSVKISPPPRPVLKVTVAEQEAERNRLTQFGETILKWIIRLLIVGSALLAVVVLWGYFRRNRRQAGRGPQSSSNRPVTVRHFRGTMPSNSGLRH